jgi:hypothetical protein
MSGNEPIEPAHMSSDHRKRGRNVFTEMHRMSSERRKRGGVY